MSQDFSYIQSKKISFTKTEERDSKFTMATNPITNWNLMEGKERPSQVNQNTFSSSCRKISENWLKRCHSLADRQPACWLGLDSNSFNQVLHFNGRRGNWKVWYLSPSQFLFVPWAYRYRVIKCMIIYNVFSKSLVSFFLYFGINSDTFTYQWLLLFYILSFNFTKFYLTFII